MESQSAVEIICWATGCFVVRAMSESTHKYNIQMQLLLSVHYWSRLDCCGLISVTLVTGER